MIDDQMSAVYSLVERAYVRLQAGEVIVHCLEEGTSAPMQRLVEGLVVAGPQNLDALREIIAEVDTRKSQLQNDISQILDDMDEKLEKRGISASIVGQLNILDMTPEMFIVLLEQEGIIHEAVQLECLSLLQDSREMVYSVLENLSLLEEVDQYLKDWMWGLIYQMTRDELSGALITTTHSKWPH